MKDPDNIEQKGTEAVCQLRLQKLQNGLYFMITFRNLPPRQCYLEYPDGKIELVELPIHTVNFKVIRILTENESARLLKKYNLPIFHI